MCLAIPTQITSINSEEDTAVVSLDGISKEISIALIEGAVVGDYVLVHVGYALNIVSQEEAAKTLALMAEAGLVPDPAEENPA
ncbi:MAG: HypC/HybG/HupF family hydrogenase formation chaperone [Rhodospirillales bacterium]|jgi:hydrogenase expression/formation protein HypC|nr:HypC/HybG/HupF family hydrogenase formation chaperone [Rhodospirillales bacterium]